MPLFHPAQSVAANIVAVGGYLAPKRRVLFQRHGAGKESRLDLVLLEKTQQSPDAGSSPVFPLGFSLKAAGLWWLGGGDFAVRLVSLIPIRRRQLGALFVVDDQRERDLRSAGPFYSG